MTAMMAFFLVLWIISATDKNTKTLIARYFNPVKVEEPAKAQKGIHGAPEQDTDAPGEEAARPTAGITLRPGDAARGSSRKRPKRRRRPNQKQQGKADPKPPPPDPAKPYPTMSEAGAVPRSAREPRQDRRRPAAGAALDPSAALRATAKWPERRRGVPRPFRPLGSDRA